MDGASFLAYVEQILVPTLQPGDSWPCQSVVRGIDRVDPLRSFNHGLLGGGTWTGPLLTKTLLFVGHGGRAIDGRPPVLRAFDKASGDVVHVVELPEIPNGTPMTYMADGRQFIVVASGAGEQSRLVALALP